MTELKIIQAGLYHCRIPLMTPYVLSFVTVNHVDSLVVRIIVENGNEGVAEAVPLLGYSHETVSSIVRDLKDNLSDLIGLSSVDVEPFLIQHLPNSPFAVSSVLTAKEFAFGEFDFPAFLNIPMIAPVSSGADVDSVAGHAIRLYQHGYRTIKLKVGRDVEQDRSCIIRLLDIMPPDTLIRIDANQGYSLKEACRFLDALQHKNNAMIECLEQPFSINAWNIFRQFVVVTAGIVPLMLDESIVKESDVAKAAEYGADMIKLKLFKHRGLNGLLSLVNKAKRIGIGVILGNGVATEIGNLAEAIAFQHDNLFTGAFEGNGFKKLANHILTNSPKEHQGNLIWEYNSTQGNPMKIRNDFVQLIYEG